MQPHATLLSNNNTVCRSPVHPASSVDTHAPAAHKVGVADCPEYRAINVIQGGGADSDAAADLGGGFPHHLCEVARLLRGVGRRAGVAVVIVLHLTIPAPSRCSEGLGNGLAASCCCVQVLAAARNVRVIVVKLAGGGPASSCCCKGSIPGQHRGAVRGPVAKQTRVLEHEYMQVRMPRGA